MSPRRALLALLVTQLGFFLFFSRYRFACPDEGLYLMAAKLVSQGQRPYLDFFYQQMPALPYVYGAWMKLWGVSWDSGRLLSVLLTTALGGLLWWHVLRLFSSPWLAFVTGLLYMLNSMVFSAHTLVKTYALSNLLLFGAYLAGFASSPLLSGLLLGLAVETRLYLIALAPVLLVWTWRQAGRSLPAAGRFLTGLSLGLAPCLFFLFQDNGSFLYDNLLYHLNRSSQPILASLKQKLAVLLLVTNVQPAYDGLGGQFALLAAATALGVVIRERLDPRLLLAFATVATLVVVCLLPSPSFSQYFCVCVPYLLILTAGFERAAGRLAGLQPLVRRLGGTVAVLFALVYTGYAVFALHKYTVSGHGVPGVESSAGAADWKIETIRSVSGEIQRRLRDPEETVAAFWPGHLIECDCAVQPGWENQFALPASFGLPPEQASRYRLPTDQTLRAGFGAHTPRLVILGNGDFQGMESLYRGVLAVSGYRRVYQLGAAQIYAAGD